MQHILTGLPYDSSAITSGAMKSGVPRLVFKSPSFKMCAVPKSPSLQQALSSLIRILSPFISK